MDLAELHRLRLVDVAGGPQDKEKRVPVALQLRALMGVDRVLDRELVEIELTRHSRELILSRLVKAEPHDPAAVAARSREIGEPDRLADPPAIAVDRGIHDHVEQATPSAVRLDPGCHFAPRATRRSAAPPNCPRWFRPALRLTERRPSTSVETFSPRGPTTPAPSSYQAPSVFHAATPRAHRSKQKAFSPSWRAEDRAPSTRPVV